MAGRSAQAPPSAPPKAGGGFNLSRWVRGHQGQAAAIAGAVLVAGYALYQRRKNAAAASTSSTVPTGAMATIQPYDPATAATGGFYTGGGASGGSPDSAGGIPVQDPQTAAQLANLEAQLGALSAGQQSISTQLTTPPAVGAPPTASTPAPSPTPSNSSLFGIESQVAGIFSAAGVPVTYGDTSETGQQRLERIAQGIQSGQRTYQSVTNDVQWLAQQQKAASTGGTA